MSTASFISTGGRNGKKPTTESTKRWNYYTEMYKSLWGKVPWFKRIYFLCYLVWLLKKLMEGDTVKIRWELVWELQMPFVKCEVLIVFYRIEKVSTALGYGVFWLASQAASDLEWLTGCLFCFTVKKSLWIMTSFELEYNSLQLSQRIFMSILTCVKSRKNFQLSRINVVFWTFWKSATKSKIQLNYYQA